MATPRVQDAEALVSSFRVVDLKKLCTFARLGAGGVKADLVARVTAGLHGQPELAERMGETERVGATALVPARPPPILTPPLPGSRTA